MIVIARHSLLLVSLLLLAATPATAGTIIEMLVTDADGENSGNHRLSVEGNQLRMDTLSTDGAPLRSMIFLGDSDELMMLDHESSKAVLIDDATVTAIASRVKAARAEMEAALAEVPAAQRQMMESMLQQQMASMMPPEEVVRKTDETGTTNGYSWTKYEVLANDQRVNEHLVTDWSNLDIQPSDFAVMEEMAEFFQRFAESANLPVNMDNPLSKLDAMNGFPVITRDYTNGVLAGVTELLSIESGDIDAELFSNPGYKVERIDAGDW